jgi:hypothetical protein
LTLFKLMLINQLEACNDLQQVRMMDTDGSATLYWSFYFAG